MTANEKNRMNAHAASLKKLYCVTEGQAQMLDEQTDKKAYASMTDDEKQKAFSAMLKNYELARMDKDNNPIAYSTALQTLGTVIAYSVLNKCIDPQRKSGKVSATNKRGTGDGTLVKIRRELTETLSDLDRIAYASTIAYTVNYDKQGNAHRKVADSKAHKALENLLAKSFGDGLDLANEAMLAIEREETKTIEREGTLTAGYMERPYTVRQLKCKVWIKVEESKGGWETVETSPIQQAFRAVRRYISDNKNKPIAQNGYSYIKLSAPADEYETEDGKQTETDETDEIIYRRFCKYADIGGQETDYSGKDTFYTVDNTLVDDMDRLVGKLELTKRQSEIVSLRLSGYGYKAIATYFGVTHNAIINCMKKVQAKALELGFKIPKIDTESKQTESKQTESKQTESKQTESKQTESKRVTNTDLFNRMFGKW